MRALIAFLLLTSAAIAQQDPMLAWTQGLTDQDRAVMRSAVEALAKEQAADPLSQARLKSILRPISGEVPFGVRDAAYLGMALSRASKDPVACVLLRKLEPSAVCMK